MKPNFVWLVHKLMFLKLVWAEDGFNKIQMLSTRTFLAVLCNLCARHTATLLKTEAHHCDLKRQITKHLCLKLWTRGVQDGAKGQVCSKRANERWREDSYKELWRRKIKSMCNWCNNPKVGFIEQMIEMCPSTSPAEAEPSHRSQTQHPRAFPLLHYIITLTLRLFLPSLWSIFCFFSCPESI